MKKPIIPVKFPEPLNKSVIIERIVGKTKTTSGLELTEDADDNNVGRIMAVAENCNPKLRPGLKVMYNRFADREILFDEKYYLIMPELDLFCLLPDEAVLLPQGKSHKEKKRTEAITRQDGEFKRRKTAEANRLDKKTETFKKKTRIK